MIKNENNLILLLPKGVEGNQQGSIVPVDNVNFNPNYLYFLGGFVEGEGSNSVSISVSKTFKYGINI